MSKRSQEEARQMKDENEQQRHLKFSTTLKGYLSTFAQLYRQEITDEAAGAYLDALKHLSPTELKTGCDESVKRCKFFPNPAEILESLKLWRDQNTVRTAVDYEDEPMTEEQKLNFNDGMKKLWAELETKRKNMPRLPVLTDAEREARQASYFGYSGPWTPDQVKKPQYAPTSVAVREPGDDDV